MCFIGDAAAEPLGEAAIGDGPSAEAKDGLLAAEILCSWLTTFCAKWLHFSLSLSTCSRSSTFSSSAAEDVAGGWVVRADGGLLGAAVLGAGPSLPRRALSAPCLALAS